MAQHQDGGQPAGTSHSEEDEEGDHQTEESHGLGQGKAQDGVGEELLLERRVPGIADDQAAKHGSDAGPGSGHTHRGSPSANELGGCVNVSGDRAGLEFPPDHLELGGAAGLLSRGVLGPTQEGGGGRPDQAPGATADL